VSKQFWAVVVIIVLIFVGIFVFTGKKNPSSSNKNANSANLSEHIEGQGKAGVALVEYGDYQCPYCGQAYPVIKQAVSDLASQITFQFRNYPLTSLHPNAFAGARAAEAAALQGKFWQMHDLLYDQNDAYYSGGQPPNSWIGSTSPISYFDADARQLGLNVTKFNSDFNSNQVDNTILADMNEGSKLGIQGTPTFYLDGKPVTLPYQSGVSAVEQVIQSAIAKKTGA